MRDTIRVDGELSEVSRMYDGEKQYSWEALLAVARALMEIEAAKAVKNRREES